MAWTVGSPAGTDAANTMDTSIQANNTALDTWASAITDGIAQAGATILKAYRSALTTIIKWRSAAGDTADRFAMDTDGKQSWGSGAATADVTLERGAANVLQLGEGDALRSGTNNRTLIKQSMARVTRTGTLALTTSDAAVGWDAEDYDTDTLHDNSTNNSRLTATVAGKYRITAYSNIGASASNAFRGKLRVNGTTVIADEVSRENATLVALTLTADYALSATGYVEVLAAMTAETGTLATSSSFSMYYVGE